MDSHPKTCQAGHRTKDHYSPGVVTLTGSFARAHRDEQLGLARHHEQAENTEPPLNRLMAVGEPGGATEGNLLGGKRRGATAATKQQGAGGPASGADSAAVRIA